MPHSDHSWADAGQDDPGILPGAIMQEFDPTAFSGTTRLFPLGGVVMFPHAVLPLHIFEPRYRQMTHDALISDKLITIVQPRQPTEETARGPALETVGCLGQIIMHERLPDGRYNMLLSGLKRVRLTHEFRRPDKLYREANVELLEDNQAAEVSPNSASELCDRFLELLKKFESGDPMASALKRAVQQRSDNGVLADLVAQALTLPSFLKQALLEEQKVPDRVEALLRILRPLTPELAVEPDPKDGYPPTFSLN